MQSRPDTTTGTESGAGARADVMPSLAIGALASIAAGTIHATAAGAHSEHRPTVVAFALLAAFQIAWGVGALALAPPRGRRWIIPAGVAGTTVAVAGWILAKTTGLGFVTGLEHAEGPQFADTLAAVLAAVAVLAVLAVHVPRLAAAGTGRRPALVGAATFAALALGIPGMVSAGSHSHAGGHGEGHSHGHEASATPAKPYDATLPVDFSGAEPD